MASSTTWQCSSHLNRPKRVQEHKNSASVHLNLLIHQVILHDLFRQVVSLVLITIIPTASWFIVSAIPPTWHFPPNIEKWTMHFSTSFTAYSTYSIRLQSSFPMFFYWVVQLYVNEQVRYFPPNRHNRSEWVKIDDLTLLFDWVALLDVNEQVQYFPPIRHNRFEWVKIDYSTMLFYWMDLFNVNVQDQHFPPNR